MYRYYGVIVVEDPPDFDPSTDDVGTLYPNLEPYNERGDLDYYITAAWNNEEVIPDNFTVGDKSTTFATRNGMNESYFNARLESATSYCVYVQVQTYSANVSNMLVCGFEAKIFLSLLLMSNAWLRFNFKIKGDYV